MVAFCGVSSKLSQKAPGCIFAGAPRKQARAPLAAFLRWPAFVRRVFFYFGTSKDYSPICQTFRTHQGCLRAFLRRSTSPATTAGPRAMGSHFGAPQLLQRQLRRRERRQRQQPKSGVAANVAISHQGLDAEIGVNRRPSCLATAPSGRQKAVVGFAARTRETGTSRSQIRRDRTEAHGLDASVGQDASYQGR